MKAFLTRHGEKIFLLLVALGAGWSLVTSLRSLGAAEVLPERDVRAIEKIDNEFRTRKAPQKAVAPYGEWLKDNLDGHGIYALDFGKIASPLAYEPPLKGTVTEPKVVAGTIKPPGGLSAAGDRGKVTFSWGASVVENMKVERFEVFRREEGGEWSARSIYSGPNLSFEDKPLKPETEYAYKVRAVGSPAAVEGKVVRPEAPPLVKMDGELWCTAFAGEGGEAKATTKSDIDFECSSILNRFGKDYARIVIKRWNGRRDDWDRFATEYEEAEGVTRYGVAVGEKVVGQEIPKGIRGPDSPPLEMFDSGYVVKEIFQGVVPVKTTVRRMQADGTWKEEEVEVPTVVKYVVLENPQKKKTVKIPVGKGDKTPDKKTEEKPEGKSAAKSEAKSQAKKAGGSAGGIDELRARFEASAGGGAEAERERAAAAEARAPAAAVVRPLQEANTTIRLAFPEGWSVSQDIAADLGVALRGLSDGMVTAYKEPAGKSGVVVLDKAFPEGQIERLLGRSPAGVPPERLALLLAQGLLRMDKEIVGRSTVKAEPGTVATAAKAVVGTFAFAYAEGDASVVVSKYCATAAGRVYVLAFVCREKDYDALKDSFEKVAGTWTW